MPNLPIVKRTYLADGSYLQNIIGATTDPGKKLEFPYKLPVIETSVSLDEKTTGTLITVSSIIAGGLVLSSVIRFMSK